VAFEQCEEAILEVAQRDVAAERAAERRRALLRRVADDAGLDLPRGDPVVDPGLVACAREVGVIEPTAR
jgi:hypothetical protein